MQHIRGKVLKHAEVPSATAAGNVEWREFLVTFVHRYLDFRVPDFESVAEYYGVKPSELTWRMSYGDDFMSPYWFVRLPSEELAAKITERCMLTRGVYELWGEGSSWEELQGAVEAFPMELKAPWMDPENSFKIEVSPFGARLNAKEIVRAVEKMSFLDIKGRVDLKKPDVRYWLIICQTGAEKVMGLSDSYAPDAACEAASKFDDSALPVPPLPFRMFFGREMSLGDRSRIRAYRLNDRKYLGPTSMDAEMAFLMANAALAGHSQLVYEPYAGTGSIMVALAVCGAHVLGSDIDIKVICAGKKDSSGKQLTVRSNFEQYNLQSKLSGLIRMDVHRHPFRADLEEVFHSICGDPPYGVRAGGRKTGSRADIEIMNRETHIPSTDPYNMGECLRDLLDLSARLLVLGGRLVYFFPASIANYSEEEIPQHPALMLLTNVPQMLSSRYCRRLIVMEKVKKYDADAAAKYHEEMGEPILSVDNLHEEVYEPRDKKDKKKDKARFRGKTV